jgi:hypothetical protein
VDVAGERGSPLTETVPTVAETVTFGAVDIPWTPPLRTSSSVKRKQLLSRRFAEAL